MKRQLGPMLVAVLLVCAPVAWSQSGSTDSGQDQSQGQSNGSTQTGYPDPSQSNSPASPTGYPDPSQSNLPASSTGYPDPSQSGPVTSSPTGYPDPSQAGPGDASSQQSPTGPQSTFNHPEQLPPLSLLNEVTAQTGIRLNFQTGAVADHQSGNSSYGSYWQNIGLFSGGIQISQVRPTLLWTVAYNGGVSVTNLSSGVPGYNSLNQQGEGAIHWAFDKRWVLRIKDNYLYTNDPFEPFLTAQIQPTYNNPNPLIFVPQAVTETNFGTADLSYALGPRDSLDFSGSESFQRFLRGTFGLQNSYTWGGAGFYQHAFSETLSAGVGYNFTALDFGHGQSRAGIQMIETFVSYKLNPRVEISAWVGPQFTNNKDLVPVLCIPGYGCLYEIKHDSSFNLAEGGTFSWSGIRNAIRLKISHRVTNGGGLLGVATLYQADLAYLRPLTPRWSFRVGADYANSVSVSTFRLNQYLKAVQGTVGFSRKITDAWNANMYYALIHQSQDYFAGPSKLTTNGVGITVRYTWGHSLGR